MATQFDLCNHQRSCLNLVVEDRVQTTEESLMASPVKQRLVWTTGVYSLWSERLNDS